jgi:CRISPR-associated protein Cas2
MQVLVMFDLPVETATQRRRYRVFRKKLIQEGFVMMQYSMYRKLALNHQQANRVEQFVEKIKPLQGQVWMVSITDKQFKRGKWIVGGEQSIYIQNDERVIVI